MTPPRPAPPGPVSLAPAPPRVPPPRLPPSCLVVDDSRTIRRMLRHMLEAHGCAVEEAACGLEALAACRAGMPGCILLDWTMPGMGGLEFLLALRAEFARGLPAVVFCTARTEPACRSKAMAAGARGYLTKPYDPADMLAALAGIGVL